MEKKNAKLPTNIGCERLVKIYIYIYFFNSVIHLDFTCFFDDYFIKWKEKFPPYRSLRGETLGILTPMTKWNISWSDFFLHLPAINHSKTSTHARAHSRTHTHTIHHTTSVNFLWIQSGCSSQSRAAMSSTLRRLHHLHQWRAVTRGRGGIKYIINK